MPACVELTRDTYGFELRENMVEDVKQLFPPSSNRALNISQSSTSYRSSIKEQFFQNSHGVIRRSDRMSSDPLIIINLIIIASLQCEFLHK